MIDVLIFVIDVLIFVAVLGMSLYLSKGGKKP
jgi:hypothetical protein